MAKKISKISKNSKNSQQINQEDNFCVIVVIGFILMSILSSFFSLSSWFSESFATSFFSAYLVYTGLMFIGIAYKNIKLLKPESREHLCVKILLSLDILLSFLALKNEGFRFLYISIHLINAAVIFSNFSDYFNFKGRK